ncbi:Mannosyl-glycoprotein endo-beta-N-acetylglucosaminidase [Caloranaerobacter azorensis DSM 13643]|uniref:N-acetylmuramoyl-L-alanine amidase n=1 Tax=Caloranaerobacter azorensis DSM 13643 TaxID=1121264 RepID=A0A1M5VLM1_9FIRM|nr:N-acetylmuramoyl-L-alanine amidase [Caloranaerobacter azorensis]SHH76131.1 Mannosyl-glycoprotein endo-beta-N-acetylglucosaminidase [Caloranaerobacter azorensis DSM 13643]
MNYKIQHIPKDTPYNRRPGLEMQAEYITIHSTANPRSTAQNERDWLVNKNNHRTASWHIAIDEKEAVEAIPLNEVAWHAGDGNNGTGNRKSIAIEICESGDRAKTVVNATKLVAQLLYEKGWGIDRVKRHYDWNGKICPRIFAKNNWENWRGFLIDVERELEALKKNKQEKIRILGKAQATAEQMKKYLLSINPNPKINCTVDELVSYYLEEGEIEGVRGDIAFAQSLKETGFFRFGGIVQPKQNNFAGIGALNNNGKGQCATFPTPRIGVRAQIQHLKGYATTEKPVQEIVDPRYQILIDKGLLGTAPYVTDLNGKWAWPGKGYGEGILKILNKILAVKVETVDYKKLYFSVREENKALRTKVEELRDRLSQIKKIAEV